jgi:quinoprotein glucose dehydrogenase
MRSPGKNAVWERPLESMELGGPIVTAGGVVFAAGTREPYLRAFNKSTGEELWKGKLPAPAQATPMTYSIDGRQFVVIAAGGHGLFETPQGDSLVAYALPK